MGNNPREQLAGVLKRAREEAGCGTQAAFARASHISRPVISRAEKGEHPVPTTEVLAGYTAHTGADPEELRELVKRATGGTPEWFMSYRHAEAEATTLRAWTPLILPGLLQTEAYAREVIAVSEDNPARVQEYVEARMERQRILERVHFIAVIGARALRTEIGSAADMAELCTHLADVAGRPSMRIHIVPSENTGMWAGLDIASKGTLATVCLSTSLDELPRRPVTPSARFSHGTGGGGRRANPGGLRHDRRRGSRPRPPPAPLPRRPGRHPFTSSVNHQRRFTTRILQLRQKTITPNHPNGSLPTLH